MRHIFFLWSFLFLWSCNSNKKYETPKWLQGKWIRVLEEKNKETYEFWAKDFNGIGFTLQDKDTVFVEKMSIFNNENNVYLQVTGLDQKPTFFKFTKQSKNSFTAENNANQFPKKIYYNLENDTLKAAISNDEFSVDFNFVRIQ